MILEPPKNKVCHCFHCFPIYFMLRVLKFLWSSSSYFGNHFKSGDPSCFQSFLSSVCWSLGPGSQCSEFSLRYGYCFLELPISPTCIYVPEKQWHPTPVLLPGKIPWTDEPGGLQSMGSWRVGHDWATSLSLFTLMHCRRKWQPTPVFLPWESQGWGSLMGCCLWGRTESDMTEAT